MAVDQATYDELQRDFELACDQKREWRDRARAAESVLEEIAESYPSTTFHESETYFDGHDRPTNRRLARMYLAETPENFAALVQEARRLFANGTEDELIAFLTGKPIDVVAKVSG